MIDLETIALSALVVFVIWYWLKTREIKEAAYLAAKKYCEEHDLEVLDQAVVLKGLKLKRNAKGRVQIYRRYSFDFTSSGDDRYEGFVFVLGNRIETVQLATHRIN
jgi:Protein of unknown function (DUF3301)